MIAGSASPEATAAFAARFVKDEGVASGHYRTARGLTFASIGLGTYLGDSDTARDTSYHDAIVEYVRNGGNVLDTAINYRSQRSERAVGAALATLTGSGALRRESLVVCTKVGYVAPDGRPFRTAREAEDWLEATFFSKGILRPEDVAERCHAMAPAYLRHQLRQSLFNLGLATIDVYYLHNPETQARAAGMDAAELTRRFRAAFETLEAFVAEGSIRHYGVATWGGFRVPPTDEGYLSLEDLTGIARSVAGDGHHFHFLQAPMNLGMLEVLRFANQRVGTKLLPLFEAAHELEFGAVASAALYQGKLAERLPPQIAELFPGFATDAQRAIQFARSAPRVLTSLVGMASAEHVREAAAIAKRPPAPDEIVKKLLRKLA